MNVKTTLLLLTALLLTSCGSSRKASVNEESALQFDKEQVWQLVSIRGKEVRSSDGVVTLMFYPEGNAIRGLIACNRYFADYTMRFDKVSPEGSHYELKITDLSGGDVQCPEGDMAVQDRYLALLEKSDACLLTPYTLTLFRNGKEVLKYELQ